MKLLFTLGKAEQCDGHYYSPGGIYTYQMAADYYLSDFEQGLLVIRSRPVNRPGDGATQLDGLPGAAHRPLRRERQRRAREGSAHVLSKRAMGRPANCFPRSMGHNPIATMASRATFEFESDRTDFARAHTPASPSRDLRGQPSSGHARSV